MASIISSGIGSGLDIAGIVQQLVAAEGQPVETRITQKEARAQAKLSAFGSLKSALSDFRDKLDVLKSADKFLQRKASSGNEDVFTVAADGNALPARYDVEVVQLAQAQKLTSGAFIGSDAVVGTGQLSIFVGAESMLLDVTTENNTLADIADGINSAQNNPGINASIVNATAGSYLILTSEKTGTGQPITITQSGGDGGLSVLEWDPLNGNTSLTESIAAQDAQIRIDGFDVVSQTNEFDTAVQGVTISIFAESFGATESLVVENDQEAVRNLVNDFVESYNALIETFDSLTAYNSESELAAPLLGDASIRGIRDQVRREMSEAVNDIEAPFSMLSDVGIETQLDGKLEINDTKLSEILAQDFAKFGQLFSTTDGFGTRLYDLADGYLNSGGIIETRTQGLEETIDGFTDDREALNERLASLETRLLRQFNALDSLLAQLSSTSNFLTQQLNSLPGAIRPDGN